MNTREKFYQGQILRIGEVLSEGIVFDRRANHIVVLDSNGKMFDLGINEASNLILSEEIQQIPHSFYGVPEHIIESLEPHIATATDQYNIAVCLRGIAVLASSRADSSLLEAIQSRIDTWAPDFDLNAAMTVVPRLNGVTESDLVRLVNANYFVLTESIKEYEHRLASMKPDDVDYLADKVKDFGDIVHHYDDDELTEIIKEHMSRMTRIHKAMSFRKSESKRERAKSLALKRMSSPTKIKSKARKAAVELIKEKLARKKLDKLSIEEKERLEDMIQRRKDLVDRLSTKLIPKIREIEKNRLYNDRHTSAEHHVNEGWERTDDADDEEVVVVVDGKNIIRKHPSGAVFSNGGLKDEHSVSI